MKKRILTLSMIVIMASTCICSCGSKGLSFEKIEMPGFENKQGYTRNICYANEKCAVFTLGKKVKNESGSHIETEYISIYDFKNQKVKKEIKIDKNHDVGNAIPYKNGILYVSYEFNKRIDLYEWNILFQNESEQKVLDCGICSYYERIPQINLVSGKPIFIFENLTTDDENNREYTCGVKQISDMKIDEIFVTSSYELLETTIDSNGKEYCFLAVENKKLFCFIGDLDGITKSFPIEDKIGSFDMNSDYIIVSIEHTEETGEKEYQLLTYDLKKDELHTHKTEEFLYRLKGGAGENCVCVDWKFTPYKVNLEEGELKKIDIPKKSYKNAAIRFLPLSKNAYIAEFLLENNETAYYRIVMD